MQLVPPLIWQHLQEQPSFLLERSPEQAVGCTLQEVVFARQSVICLQDALGGVTIYQVKLK
jgi:hypothetical protein